MEDAIFEVLFSVINYVCIIKETIIVSFFFSVARPPRIRNPSKDKVTVIEGNPLLLVCEAEGFPVPIITWTKNGKLLTDNENKTKFIINDASKKDAGKYKCEASNSAGRASYTSTVEVTGKGEFYKINLSPTLSCMFYYNRSFN